MQHTIRRAARLTGAVSLPADKSIGHRAAILAALGDGVSTITHFPAAADPHATLGCLRGLGVRIEEGEDATVTVHGEGLRGLQPPDAPLDCQNAGTAMRLLAGVLAGQPFGSVLTGDASLQSRPMRRIAEPLAAMGAKLRLTRDGTAPIRIRGGRALQGMTYRLPVASAQVKSCVLLAGLFAEGTTTVVEPVPARDHTERMLGLRVDAVGGARHIHAPGGHRIPARAWTVPGDVSAAAFFLVAGSVVEGSALRLDGVGLNPTRAGVLDVLRGMGADIAVHDERIEGGEPVGDLVVRAAPLTGAEIGGTIIPNLIDEIPVLAVAAACAEGRTTIRDAAELRVKETDRLDAMARNLRALGVHVTEHPDGLTIDGVPGGLQGAVVPSFDDHRIAMAMGVAGLVAHGPVTVQDAACARVSFPGFWDALDAVAER